MSEWNLNERANRLADMMAANAASLRVGVHQLPGGARGIDCGLTARGGYEAGLALARICLADLGAVCVIPGRVGGVSRPMIQVVTDHPVAACMASQYAGWKVAVGDYFAMASGPMRAAAGREELFGKIGLRERPEVAVGVLESRAMPDAAVVEYLAEHTGVAPEHLTLLVAPTASQAGSIQIVSRSVETALHKLVELDFDLDRIETGIGIAPLPPMAANDLAALGRTNDAILYGARVILQVRGDDSSLIEVGPSIPSSASRDHGEPFAAIFRRYDQDFYKIDPLLFSPAEIVFENLDTGRTHRFGHVNPRVLRVSFFAM